MFILFIAMVPNVLASVLIGFAFKFANQGDVNTGIIPVLFGLASFLNTVVFYFKFG